MDKTGKDSCTGDSGGPASITAYASPLSHPTFEGPLSSEHGTYDSEHGTYETLSNPEAMSHLLRAEGGGLRFGEGFRGLDVLEWIISDMLGLVQVSTARGQGFEVCGVRV